MNENASLYIGDTLVFKYDDYSPIDTVSLFSKLEAYRLYGEKAKKWALDKGFNEENIEEIVDIGIYEFSSTCGVILDRLKILGFNLDICEAVFNSEKKDKINRLKSIFNKEWAQRDSTTVNAIKNEVKKFNNFTFDDLKKSFTNLEAKNLTSIIKLGGVNSLFEYVDDRLLLFLACSQLDASTTVSLEATYAHDEGHLDVDTFNIESIPQHIISGDNNSPIIITEGKFDKFVLSNAISILHPELVDRLKFLDYEYRNEGGASAVVSMIKSFAAAGIKNRIVAILDNDSASREAVHSVRVEALPNNFKILHYPDIEIASNYPTIGPQNYLSMNINKLACSVEMYLGRDCLSDENGELFPVQWKGLMPRVNTYQGELIAKSVVQNKFKLKVSQAKKDSTSIVNQDWNNLEILIRFLIDELSKI